ncbi:GNAT family N-acetyltransferase [Aeoliella sp. ICT_H6.2]|uniref:GNAT family N-acetyltransferase n=1 Tax=Aeoliella straminimaris TaxID=2954799 RepID=A0A9X2FFQ1_9BACT|nr:GNAT family N-acetyltransferase [Aeoliella straminimaris]MCO6043291.1 GNAT family N-acetyltransferase [Aeoliella straminimaris]
MAEVVEVNDLRSLSRYRLMWDSLLADTPNATFLHTFDWLENYWRHFGSGKRLRVLVVRAAGQGIGILPLCVVRRRHRLGSLRVLTYPLDDWGSFYGPIGPSPTATLLTALRHVASSPRDWDQLELPWIAHDSRDHGRTFNALRQVGLPPRVMPQGMTSLIDCAALGNWESYQANLSRKRRHELRRVSRRVTDWGEAEFVRHRPEPRRDGDGDPAWELYDQCEEVARQSWQNTSATGNTLSHPKLVSFFRDTHAAASRLGMVDLAVLRLSGRPVAFWYGYRCEGRVMGLRMGYCADAPVSGVGTALMSRLVEDSFRRGDQSFDLGPGNECYKSRLRTSVVNRHRVTHTPATAIGPQLIRASGWLRQRTASTVRLAVGG